MTTEALPTATTARPPAPVVGASALAVLASLVGGYGSLYFSGLGGWSDDDATFVTTYLSISLFGVVSAVALLRGSSHGRLGLIAWGLFMAVFTVVKLVTIQEVSAIVFGVVGTVVLFLALVRATREWTGEAQPRR